MTARSKARKRALDVLYAAEARGVNPLTVLDERMQEPSGPERHSWTPIGDYAEGLVRGVVEHQDRIDDLLAENSRGWTVERMPAVDRAILRIAVFELLYSPEVPPAVVVNEAVDSAKVLSTDDSPRFVNGILGQLAVMAPRLRGA
jgi:N utilization substance protein B